MEDRANYNRESNYIGIEERYTVMAWLLDKRYCDDCRLQTYNTNSLEDAMAWISRIKKAHGDSVVLIDRETSEEINIELRDDQRADKGRR